MRAVPFLLALVATAAPAAAQANDADIPLIVEQLFADRPDDPFVSVVYRDDVRFQYLALHISTYLDVKELRAYLIPFRNADVATVDAALAASDHEAAYQELIANMRLELGAKYVSDAGLNGVTPEPVPIGSGSLRDNFHQQQFADHAAANQAYRDWLTRALELRAKPTT